jgi:hypothetical protein
MGMLLGMVVLPANFSDDYGAKRLLQRIPFVSRWCLFLLDGGYDKPPLTIGVKPFLGLWLKLAAV